jgi:Uncharacterised protein family (UPF0158)
MIKLTNQQIEEIASDLEMGFKVCIHKITGEILNFPDELRMDVDPDEDAFVEDKEKYENNSDDYIEIEAMSSTESFEVMESFTQQVSDKILQEKLYDALSKNRPFRRFKDIIDDEGDYRTNWFEYKNRKDIEWVNRQIEQ